MPDGMLHTTQATNIVSDLHQGLGMNVGSGHGRHSIRDENVCL